MTVEQLEILLASHPQAASDEVQSVLRPKAFDEKSYDRERKAKQRAIGREVYIPVPKDIETRLACLNDPERLLTTYFPTTYFEPFTEDRRDMLNSIWRAARYGGDQSIAGSRGEGKTTTAMDGSFTLILAGLTFFPVVIGKNQDAASDELKALRERILISEKFIEDFPEIGVPLQAVGPQTANARLMTVNGKFIGMYLGTKHFALPNIPTEILHHWPKGLESVANGAVMGAVGIEGRIRGFKYRSHRPTLAIIDDVEDKDSVRSDEQIQKIEEIIEEDIGGMGSSAEKIARVYLCTTLNRKCNAYKYTDPNQKPSWNGRRYRKMIKPPDRMDLVERYIELRKSRDKDDPDARVSFRFWRDNREDIERGAVISNPYSYSKKIHADGEPIELSAIQSYYNRVADTSDKAVATEIDNDPPETVGPQGTGLTAELVASRKSGLQRGIVPFQARCLTAGIDLGKYNIHWVVTAWMDGGTGVVVDYGIHKVHGTTVDKTHTEEIEPKIYDALLDLHHSLTNKNYTDTSGEIRRLGCVMIDSGTYTNAPYEFVRQVRGVWHPCKGIGNYKPRQSVEGKVIASSHLHASKQATEDLWIYDLDSSYWKKFVHEHYLTPTFDSDNNLKRGSLSLFELIENRTNSVYTAQIVAEEFLSEFIDGKGVKEYWHVHSDQNHFLDATAYACAGSEVCGVKLFGTPEELQPRQVTEATKKRPQAPESRQHGKSNIRKTPGGWMNRVRRR